MTGSERKLLALIARMVIRIARQVGLEDTAREVEAQYHETGANFMYERAEEEFAPAVMALEEAGIEPSLEHTGGGIFVLYWRWDDDPAGPHVGISPDETEPSNEVTWLVVGYRDNQDEGSSVRYRVPLAGLYERVYEARKAVEVRSWMVPGEFFIKDYPDGGLEFRFLPSGSDAGYFGPSAIDWETGEGIDDDDAEVLWDRVGDVLAPDGRVYVEWES